MTAQTLLSNIGQDSIFGIPELGHGNPSNFTALNEDQFLFQAFTSPLVLGNLYVSDGTDAGTQLIDSIRVDGPMIKFRDRVYFYGTEITDRLILGLFATDGTRAGTELVFESGAAVDSVPFEPRNFFVVDTFLLFSGQTITHGTELWRTDGTGVGTSLVLDIEPGQGSGYAGGQPAVIDDVLYFTGVTPATGTEPWRSDGTPEGTFMIQDLNPGTSNSGPAAYTASGGYIYFTGLVDGSGREVRRMRPGEPGIELIGEGGGTTDSSTPRYFVDSDGTLFYVASAGGADGLELLSYNHVGEPQVIGPTDIFPQILKPFGNGRVVFKARDSSTGRELWISDGTDAGTRRIKDLYPGPIDGVFPNISAASFHVFQDSLVYYAGSDGVVADGEFVYELFVTDGTEAGTQLVADMMPGTQGGNPGNFFTFKDRVYFAVNDSLVGREPFYLGPAEPPVSVFRSAVPNLPLQARVLPNPARAGEVFLVELALDRPLKLVAGLYDLRGVLVRDLPLPTGALQSGSHSMQWQLPSGISPGMYFIRLAGNGGVVSLRLVVSTE